MQVVLAFSGSIGVTTTTSLQIIPAPLNGVPPVTEKTAHRGLTLSPLCHRSVFGEDCYSYHLHRRRKNIPSVSPTTDTPTTTAHCFSPMFHAAHSRRRGRMKMKDQAGSRHIIQPDPEDAYTRVWVERDPPLQVVGRRWKTR